MNREQYVIHSVDEFTLATLAFVALRVGGVVDWPIWLVLLPCFARSVVAVFLRVVIWAANGIDAIQRRMARVNSARKSGT